MMGRRRTLDLHDNNGSLYGTTYAGYNQDCKLPGSIGCGGVFKLSPPKKQGGEWIEATLHRFTASSPGANPAVGVTFDTHGYLYGTTLGGGLNGWGTIFSLAPKSDGKWKKQVLYQFLDGADGSLPRGKLTLDARGSIYGSASGGGSYGNGTIFRLKQSAQGSWKFSALYEFTPIPDGAYPLGSLPTDATGNVYGTTRYGGSTQNCPQVGCGTVFEMEK
jgi:uncharacterized repeat protein (TIGR03803 family)